MNTRAAVVNRILKLCDERDLAVNELARISGVSPSTVKSIMNGRSANPGIVTLKKLCDGFGLTLEEFFATDEFRNLEQEIK